MKEKMPRYALAQLCTLIFIAPFPRAHAASIDDVFSAHQVKRIRTETEGTMSVYFVELPFDPNVGKNTSRLEAELATANGCKPFAMVSAVDNVRITVRARKKTKGCSLTEAIEPLKP